MFSVEENSVFFLAGAAAAAAGAPRSKSARITAIVERIALPPCVLPRRSSGRRRRTVRGRSVRVRARAPLAGGGGGRGRGRVRGLLGARRHLRPAGTFRGAGAYGKTTASRICRRTSMGRSILVAVLAAGVALLATTSDTTAQKISPAPRPYAPPLVGTEPPPEN